MRVCRDLPAGFVGIGSEKSVDVAVCDSGSHSSCDDDDDDVSHLLPCGRVRTRQCGLPPVVTVKLHGWNVLQK